MFACELWPAATRRGQENGAPTRVHWRASLNAATVGPRPRRPPRARSWQAPTVRTMEKISPLSCAGERNPHQAMQLRCRPKSLLALSEDGRKGGDKLTTL